MTHLFLFAVPQVLIVYVLLQLSPVEAGIAFGLGIVVNVWIHTNITVDIGLIKWLFITPDYHRVHHGTRGLSRKNLAFILTIWDRMFGTYADPEKVGEFQLGLAPPEQEPGADDYRVLNIRAGSSCLFLQRTLL